MKYNASIRKLSEIKTDALCVFTLDKAVLSNKSNELDADLDNLLTKSFKHIGFKGESASTSIITPLSGKAKQIVVVGLGSKKDLSTKNINATLDAAEQKIRELKPKTVTFDLTIAGDTELTEAALADRIIERTNNGAYLFETYKSEKSKSPAIGELNFACSKDDQSAVKKTIIYSDAKSQGVNLAKNLGNEPGNVCTPSHLAGIAKELAKQYSSISCKVLEEKDMEKLNMGAFLSVSKGSTEPGKMIIIEYKGGAEKTAPHVLVGKGITFDTGGISLKPGAKMDEMKYDMCGAASVLGTIKAIAELGIKKNIVGVIAAAENMPAGNASKPGDIVTTASGQTVEILNTDAEGRLVLCDALTYVERFKPKSVIDIATLTGACIVALGHTTSAVMSNSDEFAKTLMACGDEAEDKAWQLPISDEYQKLLDSPFADMQNIGGPAAGSITAACFLARFTKKYTWAHLDIAGTAWTSGPAKGATGRPVPLLLNYLANHAK